ncbi:10648_t:CDS:10 [Ambispora gerdemannii]|uniref:10648_t:CDS:1 n=1 Tax=Ambispora gerdemannii TaxID=144530 RepID=A0A9N9CBR0_9GLOM|nr:10648_t:CDS:10 [Ambispora gerdemannii]
MSRPLFSVSCAGLKEFKNYSILGDENKPSLVAWAIKESGCKNPIILLDELEKVEEGSQVQGDLIKLFDMYKNEGKDKSEKLFDKYYREDIELDHITFFTTVNYPENLVPLLKNKEYNQELTQNQEIQKKINLIDFGEVDNEKGDGSALEQSLLPIFDPQQNTELFSEKEKVDLSKYILIATSSTRDMGKLSVPLTSRLECVNVDTAKPRQFFLDKHFSWILAEIKPGSEGVYIGNYRGDESKRLHICQTCYKEKEQEYLQNYSFIYTYDKSHYARAGTGYVKTDDSDCYADQKDQNGKILKQKDCRHCQPWKYHNDRLKTCSKNPQKNNPQPWSPPKSSKNNQEKPAIPTEMKVFWGIIAIEISSKEKAGLEMVEINPEKIVLKITYSWAFCLNADQEDPSIPSISSEQQLRNYQLADVNFLSQLKSGAVFSEMRTGKTPTTLMTFHQKDSNNNYCVIIDEAHFLRNYQSQQSKSIYVLRDAAYKLALTGTPIVNHHTDIFDFQNEQKQQELQEKIEYLLMEEEQQEIYSQWRASWQGKYQPLEILAKLKTLTLYPPALGETFLEPLSQILKEQKIEVGLITGKSTYKEKEEFIRNFQSGILKILLCNIQSAGVGLNLSRAETIIFADRSYSPADNEQAEARFLPPTDAELPRERRHN